MQVNGGRERDCTAIDLVDPEGPVKWVGNRSLVGRHYDKKNYLVLLEFVGQSEITTILPTDFVFDVDQLNVSPDGKSVVVASRTDERSVAINLKDRSIEPRRFFSYDDLREKFDLLRNYIFSPDGGRAVVRVVDLGKKPKLKLYDFLD